MARPRGSSTASSEQLGAAAGGSEEPAFDAGEEQEGEGAGIVAQAKSKAQELAGQAQDKASDQVKSGLSTGKDRAAQTLGSVSHSLVASGQQLRDDDQGTVARYIEQAAHRIDAASTYLQNSEVDQIVSDVEDFARARPAVFLGVAFAAGALGARFLKSSRRQETSTEGRQAGTRAYGRPNRSWDREVGLGPGANDPGPADTATRGWRSPTGGRTDQTGMADPPLWQQTSGGE